MLTLHKTGNWLNSGLLSVSRVDSVVLLLHVAGNSTSQQQPDFISNNEAIVNQIAGSIRLTYGISTASKDNLLRLLSIHCLFQTTFVMAC